MRVILQRVTKASVHIEGTVHAAIQHGLMLLAGFEADDTRDDLEWMCRKILAMRIFPDDQGKMNHDIIESNGELLVISQFTLHASTRKGNRPSFIRAARPEIAIPLYESFVQMLENQSPCRVMSGVFGAEMDVHLVNHGPVTIMIDSKQRE
ncbi:MAG: D-aminoacyl-tRNA deacylase [Saprospiraceae bacterium]|nr:D-aminoacyl-tRNA deacylase [Saprospiraceae bacterium]